MSESPPQEAPPQEAPPLVLVHGLWDTPRLFDGLVRDLAGRRRPVLIPHLPHGLGQTPLETLAGRLGEGIEARLGAEKRVDVLGFSMGGVIARTWLQLLGGHHRTRRFLSVASPQQGTWTALPWPGSLLAGVADMKPGSPLLRRLGGNPAGLGQVDCHSFYSPIDLMVVPGWQAVLPVGTRTALPPVPHHRLLAEPSSRRILVEELLRP